MKSGPRDRLVTIQTYTSSENAMGEIVKSWADSFTEWAHVIYGTGQERRAAGQERRAAAQNRATLTATFRILSSARTLALRPTENRLNFDGYNWDISSVVPLDRDGVEITATRKG